MAADQELRVSITGEKSGLSTALQEAEAEAVKSSKSLAEAQLEAKAAAEQYAAAQKELANAGAGGAQILNEYRDAVIAANAAVLDARTARTEAVAAIRAEKAALDEDTRSVLQNTQATTGGISARQGATASIGMFEGRAMSANRAAAAFLSTTLGLGPVLQAAFPVIGALALGEVLWDVGKEIVKFASDAQDLSEELGTNWLSAATDKVSGLGSELEKLVKDIKAANDEADKEISKQKNIQLDIIGLKEGKSAEDTARLMIYQNEANALRMQIPVLEKRADIESRVAGGSLSAAVQATQQGLPSQIFSPVAKENAAAAVAQLQDLKEKIQTDEAEMEKLSLQAATAGTPANKKTGGESVFEKDFFKDYKASLEDVSKRERETARDQQETFDNLTKSFLQYEGSKAKADKQDEENDRRSAEEWKKNHEIMISSAEESARAAIKAADDQYQETVLQIKQQEELGIITHKVATQQLLDAQMKREASTIGGLESEAGLFDPALGAKEAAEFKRFEDLITEEARKGSLEREQIANKEAQQFIQKWKVATGEFNRDFTTALNSWATHQESASKAWGQMLGTMEKQLMDFAAKAILEHLEMWAELKIMQASGLATSVATQKTAQSQTVLADAKTAAANAFAWGSGWGGPVAGAIAAAGAFTGVMAFDVFEAGGMVQGPMGRPIPIIAHAGERVLSAGQTSNFESMVNNGGNSSRTANLNYSPTINGGANEKMLEDHSADMMRQVRRMMRPEALRS